MTVPIREDTECFLGYTARDEIIDVQEALAYLVTTYVVGGKKAWYSDSKLLC